MIRPTDIFVDIDAHIESGRFIRDNSLNTQDIRDFTFNNIDLSGCKNILDLGCAYGFFTRGLKGRLHPDARVLGVDLWEGCREYYINACRESGFVGEFCLSDKMFCKRFPDEKFDFILCSYALYFFPETISEIARVLRPEGFFITVSHTVPHMQELIDSIKKLLIMHFGVPPQTLPLENQFRNFSSANGFQLLVPWFRQISVKQYKNILQINNAALPGLIKYLCFKRPVFFPDNPLFDADFIKTVVADYFREVLVQQEFLTISKNDTVYICKKPVQEDNLLQG